MAHAHVARALERDVRHMEVEARIQRRILPVRQRLSALVAAGVLELVAAGQWQAAVSLAIRQGGMSEADLARRLDVTRSTVNRWINGQTVPPEEAMPDFAQAIAAILRE